MPKPIANAGTNSKVNLTPFVLAYVVAINHKTRKMAYFMSMFISDSHNAIIILIIIGILIKIKNVFKSWINGLSFSKNIIKYQPNAPPTNHNFLCSFFVNVSVIPINAIKKNKKFPKPTWSITELRDAGFCSATVVKTLGHIVVMPTSFSFANPVGFFMNFVKCPKLTNKLTLNRDTIKKIAKNVNEFLITLCFVKLTTFVVNSFLWTNAY